MTKRKQNATMLLLWKDALGAEVYTLLKTEREKPSKNYYKAIYVKIARFNLPKIQNRKIH